MTSLRARTVHSMAAVALLVAACSGDSDRNGAGSSTTTETTPPVTIAVDSRPAVTDPEFRIGTRQGAFEIVYVVDDPADPNVGQSLERVLASPPFDSLLDITGSTADDAEVDSRQVARFDRLRFGGVDKGLVIHRVPGPAPSDVWVAPILEHGLATGRVEFGDQRIVAGRRCQVVITSTLLGGGPLGLVGEDDFAESCIDGEGLLLEEQLFFGGELSLRRTALTVAEAEEVTADDFPAGDVVAPVDQGGGSVLAVRDDAGALGTFHVLPDDLVPEGFVRFGRFAVIPPQPERFSDETKSASIIAGVADVYVHDADVVVIYQGGTQGRVTPFAPHRDAEPMDSAVHGAGELLLSAVGSELRFPVDRGQFLHVIGTVTPDELLTIADALIETEGTGLVYVD